MFNNFFSVLKFQLFSLYFVWIFEAKIFEVDQYASYLLNLIEPTSDMSKILISISLSKRIKTNKQMNTFLITLYIPLFFLFFKTEWRI